MTGSEALSPVRAIAGSTGHLTGDAPVLRGDRGDVSRLARGARRRLAHPRTPGPSRLPGRALDGPRQDVGCPAARGGTRVPPLRRACRPCPGRPVGRDRHAAPAAPPAASAGGGPGRAARGRGGDGPRRGGCPRVRHGPSRPGARAGARAAGPGAGGDRLCGGPADQRARRRGPGQPRPPAWRPARPRQGSQGADRAARTTRARGPARVPGRGTSRAPAPVGLAGRRRSRRPSSSTTTGSPSVFAACVAAWTGCGVSPACRRASVPTRSGTASRPISSRAARTSAWSRSCSATRASPRRRCTRTCRPRGCRTPTGRRTPGRGRPDGRDERQHSSIRSPISARRPASRAPAPRPRGPLRGPGSSSPACSSCRGSWATSGRWRSRPPSPTSRQLSPFFAAFRIPDFLFQLVAAGALSSALIPVIAGLFATDEEARAWRVVSTVTTLMLSALLVLAAIVLVFAPQLVAFIAPGFDAGQLAETTQLTRIMVLSPLFLAGGAVATSALNSAGSLRRGGHGAARLQPRDHRRCGGPGADRSASPGSPTAWSWARPATSWCRCRRWSGSALASGRASTSGTAQARLALVLMAPRAIGLGATQVVFLVMTSLATTLGDDALAVFNFAFILLQIPIGVIGVPLGVVLLPSLSREAATGGMVAFRRLLVRGLSILAYVMIGIAALGIVVSEDVVRILFGVAHIGEAAIEATAGLLGDLPARAHRALADRRPGPRVLRAPGHEDAGPRRPARGRREHRRGQRPRRARSASTASRSPSPSPPGSRPSRSSSCSSDGSRGWACATSGS